MKKVYLITWKSYEFEIWNQFHKTDDISWNLPYVYICMSIVTKKIKEGLYICLLCPAHSQWHTNLYAEAALGVRGA